MCRRECFHLVVGDGGRIVLPAKVRRQLGIRKGDRLILAIEDGNEISIATFRMRARQARGLIRGQAGRRNLAAELVEERRRERT